MVTLEGGELPWGKPHQKSLGVLGWARPTLSPVGAGPNPAADQLDARKHDVRCKSEIH